MSYDEHRWAPTLLEQAERAEAFHRDRDRAVIRATLDAIRAEIEGEIAYTNRLAKEYLEFDPYNYEATELSGKGKGLAEALAIIDRHIKEAQR